MDVGLFFWGSCFIDDAGADGPDPCSRHHTPTDFAEAYLGLRDLAKLADQLGYHSFSHQSARFATEVLPALDGAARVLRGTGQPVMAG